MKRIVKFIVGLLAVVGAITIFLVTFVVIDSYLSSPNRIMEQVAKRTVEIDVGCPNTQVLSASGDYVTQATVSLDDMHRKLDQAVSDSQIKYVDILLGPTQLTPAETALLKDRTSELIREGKVVNTSIGSDCSERWVEMSSVPTAPPPPPYIPPPLVHQ